MKSTIQFFQVSGAFPTRNILRKCLIETASSFGLESLNLQYIFLNDEELLAYNKQFLQHDFYTDILTFNLSEPESGILEGEIYISRDRVAENALAFKSSSELEFCRVIAHGLLHLCGLDDHAEEDRRKMTDAENAFIDCYLHYKSKSKESPK